MKMLSAAALLFLLAGCGSAADAPNGSAEANQIERLSTPKVEKPDPSATARLEPLVPGDLEREGLLGAGCSFTRNGQLLLATVGSDSLVRFAGELRHLVHSAPVGPTGGFFEDRRLSVSVGRRGEEAAAAEAAAHRPARMTVTNRRTRAQVELRGDWTCGA
jgi:hypothetical protein